MKYWLKVVDVLPSEIQRVFVVTSFFNHQDDVAKRGFLINKRQSIWYLHAVRDVFMQSNFSVEFITNGTVDCDVIFMSNSSFFVPTGGGFGRLSGQLCEMGGGVLPMSNEVFANDIDGK